MSHRNARYTATTLDISPQQFPFPATQHDGPAVRTEGYGVDPVAMVIDHELKHLFARGDIPEFRSVVAAGEEPLAIGGECQCMDLATVSLDHTDELAASRVPEPNLSQVFLAR